MMRTKKIDVHNCIIVKKEELSATNGKEETGPDAQIFQTAFLNVYFCSWTEIKLLLTSKLKRKECNG